MLSLKVVIQSDHNCALREQADGYTCGVETWYLPKGGAEWLPGQCLLTAKPGWIGGLVEDNDGAFWAPALLDDRNMLYSVPSPFDDEGGTSCLAWIRWEFARKDCRTSNTGRPDRMLHRKWRETKQQPSKARSGHKISCCLVSLHFLSDILSGRPVV